MYGTSMSVSGGHGLGEAQDNGFDWGSFVNTGIKTITDIYTAEQAKKAAEDKRKFDLQMAKIMVNSAGDTASPSKSDGETTGDGLFGMSRNQTIGAAVGVAALGGVLYLAMRKKRR